MKKLLLILLFPVLTYGQGTQNIVAKSVRIVTPEVDTSAKVAVFDASGKLKYNRSAGGSTVDSTKFPFKYTGGHTEQSGSDSLVLNDKVSFKSYYGKLIARNLTTPTTKYAYLYINGGLGNASLYANTLSQFTLNPAWSEFALLPGPAQATIKFNNDAFGAFGFIFDEWGFYPSGYTTAGLYNQFVGIPTYPWKDGYFNKIHADTIYGYMATTPTRQLWIGVDTTAINTTDVYFMGYTETTLTVDSLVFSQRRRAGSPDVTCKVWYGVDQNSAGTAVVTAGNQVTAYATSTKTGTIDNGTIPKGSAIWATFSAVSVKPKGFFVTIIGHRQ